MMTLSVSSSSREEGSTPDWSRARRTLSTSAGENARAEKLLREVFEQQPQMYEIAYSLGLLLVEMKRYEEAAAYLADASAGMPQPTRASARRQRSIIILF